MLKNAYSLAKIGTDTAENELNFAEILPAETPLPAVAPSGAAPRRGARAGVPRRRGARAGVSGFFFTVCFAKFCKKKFVFANFWRARSRLYQNEILQENMRLTAFFKLYKICIL